MRLQPKRIFMRRSGPLINILALGRWKYAGTSRNSMAQAALLTMTPLGWSLTAWIMTTNASGRID